MEFEDFEMSQDSEEPDLENLLQKIEQRSKQHQKKSQSRYEEIYRKQALQMKNGCKQQWKALQAANHDLQERRDKQWEIIQEHISDSVAVLEKAHQEYEADVNVMRKVMEKLSNKLSASLKGYETGKKQVLSKEVVLNVQKEVNAALEQMVPDVLKGETAFQVAKAKLTSLV